MRKTQMADGSIKVEHYPLLKIDGLADCIMRRKYDATHAIGYPWSSFAYAAGNQARRSPDGSVDSRPWHSG